MEIMRKANANQPSKTTIKTYPFEFLFTTVGHNQSKVTGTNMGCEQVKAYAINSQTTSSEEQK